MTIAQQQQIQAALSSVGKEYEIVIAGKPHGNPNDQVIGKETHIKIRTRFEVTNDNSSGELVRTARGNISAVVGYIPVWGDKIIIDGEPFTIEVIQAMELADNEVLLYKIEAVA